MVCLRVLDACAQSLQDHCTWLSQSFTMLPAQLLEGGLIGGDSVELATDARPNPMPHRRERHNRPLGNAVPPQTLGLGCKEVDPGYATRCLSIRQPWRVTGV